jgi:hypothetical protein
LFGVGCAYSTQENICKELLKLAKNTPEDMIWVGSNAIKYIF